MRELAVVNGVEFIDGQHVAVWQGTPVGKYQTEAEAWRAFDRAAGEPISRKEQTAEWLFSQD